MAAVLETQEQRTILRHVSWETYEWLMLDYADSSAPHFTYDRGTLEIMSPFPLHERYCRFIEMLVQAVADRLDVDQDSLGSTTFKRADLQRGFEPDSCFYFQNGPLVRGKDRLDLRVDPPPDLVVEIDITHSSLDKLSIFGAFGVPEVWRYDGERLQILLREGDAYIDGTRSRIVPALTAAALTDILRGSSEIRASSWRRRVRAWAETLPVAPSSGSSASS